MITQDWCYNKRKVPAGAAAPVVWVERQENNMHISYKPLWLDHNKNDFIHHSKTRFNSDSFVEDIDFDFLEIQVIEED